MKLDGTIVTLFGALLVGGCADDPAPEGRAGAPLERRLCDGSNSLRLDYRIVGGGLRSTAQELTARNGFRFLFVDGKCRFWTWGSGEPAALHDVVAGTLSSDDEAALAAELRYAEWPELSGQFDHQCVADGASGVVGDGEYALGTSPACGPDGTEGSSTAVTAILSGALRWTDRLATVGTSAVGPARALLVAADADDTRFDHATVFDWPLATDPASLAVDAAAGAQRALEASIVLPDSDSDALRALRRLARDDHSSWNEGYVPVVAASGARYFLYLSDVLPFEGEDGFVDP